MPTPATLTTTLRLPGEENPVTVTTPAQLGAQAKHTKVVQFALGLSRTTGPGRMVKIGPDPRRVPMPSKTRCKGKGWQRWTEKDGRVRYGVASEAPPSEAGAGWSAHGARVVVPADGGPLFVIFRTDPGNSSDWAREGDGVKMRPALFQECRHGPLVGSTDLAA
ncbi:hypothetical protein ABH940_003171 [Streptacidiphilus sp. BW17]|uniref:hypothetical protein n=1 Tax=unclassified Streptacidiphilus TaxID=2643834 RepID=UPI003514D0AD